MNKTVLILAARLSESYLAGFNEYLQECEHYRRQGYRPQHCEHGTNQWTDYDNICGPCEDGLSMGDALYRRQHALDVAKRRYATAVKITKAAQALSDEGVDLEWGKVWSRVTELITV